MKIEKYSGHLTVYSGEEDVTSFFQSYWCSDHYPLIPNHGDMVSVPWDHDYLEFLRASVASRDEKAKLLQKEQHRDALRNRYDTGDGEFVYSHVIARNFLMLGSENTTYHVHLLVDLITPNEAMAHFLRVGR